MITIRIQINRQTDALSDRQWRQITIHQHASIASRIESKIVKIVQTDIDRDRGLLLFKITVEDPTDRITFYCTRFYQKIN